MTESDSIEIFIRKYQDLQTTFLNFLEDDQNIDINFQNLKMLFEDTKIKDCKHEVRLFIRMLLKATKNHNRGSNFFGKIEKILQYFKDEIKKYSSVEMFNLFKSNKRILLFLIEENILPADRYFVQRIIKEKYLNKKYPQYFAPEIRPFIDEEWFPKNELVEEIKKELPDNFYEFRKKGENENFLCKLIREDSVEDFITYLNRSCISHNAIINPSIYETNSFLIKKQIQKERGISLIEYAAFFGSIQIFTFLKNEGVELTPSLWFYAIHGKNASLIHLLEYDQIGQNADQNHNINVDELCKEIFNKSIKYHCNEIANYFLNHYLQNEDENSK